MTTTEKRGFRLPWGGENHKPNDEPEAGPGTAAAAVLTPATDLAPAIAPTTGTSVRSGSMLRRGQADELGRGPFDLAPAEDPDGSESATDDESIVDIVEPAPYATPKSAAQPPTDMPADDTSAPDPKGGNAAAAWPEMDRRGSAAHLASDAPPLPLRPAVVVQGGPKKVNPLVAGMVKAMRESARAARDETTARMRADAAARAEQIRLEAAAAGVALKKQADEDVAEVREWARAEAVRIKGEAESRIAARKERLVHDAREHAAAVEHMNADLKTAIAAFETEMASFFDRLLAEEDPARLATLAEHPPEPPTFAHLGEVTRPARAPRASKSGTPRASTPRKTAEHAAEPAREQHERPAARLAPDAAAAAEAEAMAELDDEPAAESATATAESTAEMPIEDAAEATMAPMAPVATAEPVEAASGPDADHDHDTNGHVAPAEAPAEDTESMAAWADALAAIRARARVEDGVAEPEPAEPEAADAEPEPVKAEDGYVDTFEAPSEGLLGVLAGASRINSPEDLSPEERIALLGFDEPAPGDEPAPMSVEPAEVVPAEAITRVVVAGLASVAEISAFKSALVGVAGVISVSVTSGADGAFVFSVVHLATIDLRSAVSGFARFAPELTADDGAVLTYAVREPGA